MKKVLFGTACALVLLSGCNQPAKKEVEKPIEENVLMSDDKAVLKFNDKKLSNGEIESYLEKKLEAENPQKDIKVLILED